MRAVRYYGPGDMRVEDIPEPVTGDGQVKIKVQCCTPLSLCVAQRSDCRLHGAFSGALLAGPKTVDRVNTGMEVST